MTVSLPRALLVVAAIVSLLAFPAKGAAQEDCEFVFPSGDLVMTMLSGGASITYVGTPHLFCRDGVEIWADSAISYSAQGMQHLIGSVRFLDANGELRADEARYFAEQGRLQAERNVFVQDTVQGFTIQNGRLIYLRQTPQRQRAQMDVTTGLDGVRPRAILTMRASTSAVGTDSIPGSDPALPSEATPVEVGLPEPVNDSNTPYVVDGDRIFIQGDTYFRATGDVEIERDSLHAFADSAEYDQAAGRILLNGSARVDGTTYDLLGETINLGMNGDDIDQVVARREAVLISEDMRLTAPVIFMYMEGSLLDRLVAVNRVDPANVSEDAPARPRVVSAQFELTADSLEVLAPAEQLDRIFAVGNARSVSSDRDSLNVEVLPEIARTDWLEGDTVIVTFVRDTAEVEMEAGSDSTSAQNRIDRIVARVGARSLYRLPPADSNSVAGTDAPAVHYVVGDEITIVMAAGQIDHMDVLGQTQGVHLEPIPISVPSDSLGADSTVVPDTSAVGNTKTPENTRNDGGGPDAPGPERSQAYPSDPWRRI
jgi:lipopolysaccharide export system protein LptA